MEEIVVIPGDSIHSVFARAWLKFKHEEAITFHHNGCQVIIFPDNAKWMQTARGDRR